MLGRLVWTALMLVRGLGKEDNHRVMTRQTLVSSTGTGTKKGLAPHLSCRHRPTPPKRTRTAGAAGPVGAPTMGVSGTWHPRLARVGHIWVHIWPAAHAPSFPTMRPNQAGKLRKRRDPQLRSPTCDLGTYADLVIGKTYHADWVIGSTHRKPRFFASWMLV